MIGGDQAHRMRDLDDVRAYVVLRGAGWLLRAR